MNDAERAYEAGKHASEGVLWTLIKYFILFKVGLFLLALAIILAIYVIHAAVLILQYLLSLLS